MLVFSGFCQLDLESPQGLGLACLWVPISVWLASQGRLISPPSLLLGRNLLSLGQLTLIHELHTSIKRGDRDRLFTTGRLLIGVSSKSSPLQANEEKAAFPPKTPSSLQPPWHPSSGHLLSLSAMPNSGNNCKRCCEKPFPSPGGWQPLLFPHPQSLSARY